MSCRYIGSRHVYSNLLKQPVFDERIQMTRFFLCKRTNNGQIQIVDGAKCRSLNTYEDKYLDIVIRSILRSFTQIHIMAYEISICPYVLAAHAIGHRRSSIPKQTADKLQLDTKFPSSIQFYSQIIAASHWQFNILSVKTTQLCKDSVRTRRVSTQLTLNWEVTLFVMFPVFVLFSYFELSIFRFSTHSEFVW